MSQTAIVKRVWKILISKKLAIALISTLTVVVTAQVLLLARVWSPSATSIVVQTSKTYSSWWFVLLAGALLVNLSACTVNSFYRRLKAGTRSAALWGSTIFHAGLVVIIIGTLITGSFRIFCSITLIQGEPKSIPYQALLTESTTGFDPNDRFTITMLEQKTLGQQTGMEKQTYSDIEIKGDYTTRVKSELTDSQQLSYREIYMFPSKYGYSVRLSVTSPDGKSTINTSVPLETVEYGEGMKEYTKTGVVVDRLPFKMSFTLYPGQQVPQIKMVAEDGGRPVDGRIVPTGGIIEAQGYRITFNNAVPWTELMTAYDPGARVVFAGILISLVGQTLFVLSGKKNIKNVE